MTTTVLTSVRELKTCRFIPGRIYSACRRLLYPFHFFDQWKREQFTDDRNEIKCVMPLEDRLTIIPWGNDFYYCLKCLHGERDLSYRLLNHTRRGS